MSNKINLRFVADAALDETSEWYGFDLDGTLANFTKWRGADRIGRPIESMCDLARKLHGEGKKVKILTARASENNPGGKASAEIAKRAIRKWCRKNLGFEPEITCEKDGFMKALYDDSARQVIRNSGVLMESLADRDVASQIEKESAKEYLNMVCDEKPRIKLLLTSDIHTSGMDGIDPKDADIVVIAGDIMGGGYRSDEEGKRYLKGEFFPWCEKNGEKEIVITAGNHDKYLYREYERGNKVDFPKNVHYLIDSGCSIKGLKFWGTPWCTKDREGRFEASSQELAETFSKIPNGLDVLISHTPPCIPGEKVDTYKGGHDGSAELTDVLLKKKPKICVCGHVHGGSRKRLEYGDTVIYNVARVEGDRSEEAYRPIFVVI